MRGYFEATPPGTPPSRPVPLTGRLVIGVALVAIGALWTLDNLEITSADAVLHWWPMLLVFYGAAKVVGWTRTRSPLGGALWIIAGAWLQLHELGIVHAGLFALWPLVIIALGVAMLSRQARVGIIVPRRMRWPDDAGGSGPGGTGGGAAGEGGGPAAGGGGAAGEGDFVKADVVMGTVQRRVVSRQFRGGVLTAVMGGIELDLRDAAPAGGRAEIEANSVLGGIEIRVPADWVVTNETTVIVGSVEDRHAPAPTPADASRPTLVLRGAAVMGGIEIQR